MFVICSIFIFIFILLIEQMHLYQVIGRKAPTATDENPPAYRMKLFAGTSCINPER